MLIEAVAPFFVEIGLSGYNKHRGINMSFLKLVKRTDDYETYSDGITTVKIYWGIGPWVMRYAHLKDIQLIDAECVARFGVLDSDGDFIPNEFDDQSEWFVGPQYCEQWSDEWIDVLNEWIRKLGCDA